MRTDGFGKHPGAGLPRLRRLARYVRTGVIGISLLLTTAGGAAWPAAAASSAGNGKASGPALHLIGETPVTAGAMRRTYEFLPEQNGTNGMARVHVIAIDLTQPYVSLNAMTGGGTVPGRATVGNMVKETGAVAGVNADYFDMSGVQPVPFGFHIAGGELVKSARGIEGMYMFGITKDRVPVIDRFRFTGSVVASNGATFALKGVNEAAFWSNEGASHANALYLYTSSWGEAERPLDASTSPTEALVQDGIVVSVSDKVPLPVRPPENGYILRGHGTAAKFILENLMPGTPVTVSYSLVSETSGKSYKADDWSMMIGGHTILVDGGAPAQYSRSVSSLSPNADRARTAIGYSRDGKTVYLVTVEKSGSSAGATLPELQQILVMLGAWRAINLDGGGSTTMVARPLGEFAAQLTHATEDGGSGTYQRPVVNGIGVYTSAPQGKLKGILISGRQVLFVGEEAAYTLKAYDEYYNPLDPSGIAVTWRLDDPKLGSLTDNILKPARPGTGTLTAKAGSASDKLAFEVIGEAQIVRMTIGASQAELAPGASISAPVSVELSDGRKLSVPAASVRWEFRGFTGTAKDGVIHIDKVKPGVSTGYAIARYDGYSALLTLKAGEALPFEDFESGKTAVSASQAPAQVTAEADLVSGLPGENESTVLRLRYDFSTSAEDRNKAAYAVLGEQGVVLPGEPVGLSVDVFGDGSSHMVRAMITDADGKDQLVTLASSLNWTGWKTVRADLASYKPPFRLKSLYVASPKEGQAARPASGEVYFDNIRLHYPVSDGQEYETVVLKIGSRQATVGDKTFTLDVAPFVENGVTYLPLRFVSDQLGGSVGWDGQAKKATLLRGDRLLELRLGSETYIVNGERKPAPAQIRIKNGRTLVPVRLVSEQLGLKVTWNKQDKTVTIE
ncbi:stalk domain-containing protein [Thermobacillus sp. ZCTH02-B1]|uniref:stalk domain-containing protein n=1 Tax=Thermobacillus sp. ZCTH02-B1 TaxID=1858795 RepID=UPI0025D6FD79|nr:stalk domain-containing protein [Thermobacillus sp. ZCTH02-B1]